MPMWCRHSIFILKCMIKGSYLYLGAGIYIDTARRHGACTTHHSLENVEVVWWVPRTHARVLCQRLLTCKSVVRTPGCVWESVPVQTTLFYEHNDCPRKHMVVYGARVPCSSSVYSVLLAVVWWERLFALLFDLDRNPPVAGCCLQNIRRWRTRSCGEFSTFARKKLTTF